MAYNNDVKVKNNNLDPITNERGAHPVGTGLGALAGAAAGIAGAAAVGATYGSVVGPAGTVAGAAVGGLIGGLAGKAVAEDVNPTAEEEYWGENYQNRPYFQSDVGYDAYRPAYSQGINAYSQNAGKSFDEIEPQLNEDWESQSGAELSWAEAKEASRDAYDRLYNRKNNNI